MQPLCLTPKLLRFLKASEGKKWIPTLVIGMCGCEGHCPDLCFRVAGSTPPSQQSPAAASSSACSGCWRMQTRVSCRSGSQTCQCCSSTACWTCSISVCPALSTRYCQAETSWSPSWVLPRTFTLPSFTRLQKGISCSLQSISCIHIPKVRLFPCLLPNRVSVCALFHFSSSLCCLSLACHFEKRAVFL